MFSVICNLLTAQSKFTKDFYEISIDLVLRFFKLICSIKVFLN